MLKQYGPNVPQHILTMLVDAFAELRCLVDVGQIAYPYSTREVVNVVKHLQVHKKLNFYAATNSRIFVTLLSDFTFFDFKCLKLRIYPLFKLVSYLLFMSHLLSIVTYFLSHSLVNFCCFIRFILKMV